MKHDPDSFEMALLAYQLPDAPMAMPRQRLERRRGRGLGLRLMLRGLLALARP